MRLAVTSFLLGLVGSGCTSAPSASSALADRLAALPEEWPPRLTFSQDAQGTVVLRNGKRVAIRLEPGRAISTGPWTMAIFDEHGYKAEFQPLARFEGHLLGVVVVEQAGKVVRIGDRAACKVP
ncbi:MAG: hypothetical protein Q7T30_01915 [Planctomycetota bacterium]|nr:hypothetical protein [Planctomycetota bacterium]